MRDFYQLGAFQGIYYEYPTLLLSSFRLTANISHAKLDVDDRTVQGVVTYFNISFRPLFHISTTDHQDQNFSSRTP